MSVTLYSVTFDCTDAARLARFWSDVLGRPVDEGSSEEYAGIGITGDQAGGPGWMFIKVPEAKPGKNRVHVDLTTSDLAAEVDRVIALGASKIADQEQDGMRWTTLADPEGNELDIVAAQD